ncbi:hypothetical protein J4416_02600 [Candidatus Pacearchaeota archaeon]|nr:hypothetical protein [Candidatus Pacearchaeota archaeon]
MAKTTLKNISIISIILSLITVILSIYFKLTTWYENKGCFGSCDTFSVISSVLTILGFIMGMVFLKIANKNTNIKGKLIIKWAMLLNLALLFIWFMNYLGVFLSSS